MKSIRGLATAAAAAVLLIGSGVTVGACGVEQFPYENGQESEKGGGAATAAPADVPSSVKATAGLGGNSYVCVFTFRADPNVTAVYLAGTFNSWNPRALAMERTAAGLWSARIDLPKGVHYYKFVLNGGQWVADPENPDTVDDNHGGVNSVLWLGVPRGSGGGPVAAAEQAQAIDLDTFVFSLASPSPLPGGRTVHTPEWARNAIWYQIMLDRFRNGSVANDPARVRTWTSEWYKPSAWEGTDGQSFYEYFVFSRHYGGDLEGLREKLPYLRDLGVTAIYLNPVFEAESYHKYNTTNYIHIDDRFGPNPGEYAQAEAVEDLKDPGTWTWTAADRMFLEVLKEARAMGFHVIIDGVFNHVGTRHPAFKSVRQEGAESPYADWFNIKSFDPFQYEGWAGFGELPVFRKTPMGVPDEVKKHIFNVTRRWMDPDGDGDPSDGIDGWRLDVPNEVPMPFWEEWCALVRGINREAYITGEIWNQAERWLDGTTFDAVMNYPFARATLEWVGHRANRASPTDTAKRLAALWESYPPEVVYALQNLYDSHDTDRLVSMLQNPDRSYDSGNRQQENPAYDSRKPSAEVYRKARLLALMQMTMVGAPMVYYGDEVGMWGADDPTNRKPMLWKDLEPYEDAAENFVMEDHLAFYRKAIALRRTYASLRTGSFRTMETDDGRNLWVYLRELTLSGGTTEQVLVALNASNERARLQLDQLDDGHGTWKTVFGAAEFGDGADSVSDTQFPRMSVPALGGRVWHRVRKP